MQGRDPRSFVRLSMYSMGVNLLRRVFQMFLPEDESHQCCRFTRSLSCHVLPATFIQARVSLWMEAADVMIVPIFHFISTQEEAALCGD